MDILIHTYGRSDRNRQHTLKSLAGAVVPTLVVQDREKHLYSGYDNDAAMHILPPHITRLAPTRDYIIHDMPGDEHVVFMDDDLHFAVRRDDDPTKFRQPRPDDLQRMFIAIDHALERYPMVGIGAREGGNRVTDRVVYNTRIMRVLAFRRSYLQTRMLTFSPLHVMEDFHINLQILRSGADTCVLNTWVSNQAQGSDAPGGCSEYRTPEVQTESAHLLAARHPGFVRVVQKETKGAWGGGARTDVVVRWKQARKSAL